MSLLPLEAHEKLVCSSCNKYLSILPVKVYPDKSVKCGRCSTSNDDGDGGTTSFLYNVVAKKFKFLCINRFEGCKEVLDIDEAKAHETNHEDSVSINCPFSCPDSDFAAYDLLRHLLATHKDASLQRPAFWMRFDEWCKEEIYFYCNNDIFAIVGYKYTAANHKLVLYFQLYGLNASQRNVRHKFKLYSFGEEVPYETGDIVSVDSGLSDDTGFTLDLSEHVHRKDLMFCIIEIWTTNSNPISNTLSIMDGSTKKALMKYTFDQISQIRNNMQYFSDFEYWVGGSLWQLTIEKVEDNNGVPHLAVYLHQSKTKETQKNLCEITANITLTSLVNKEFNVTRFLTKNKFRFMSGWDNFLNWHTFMDAKKGLVNNDFVQFDVAIEVFAAKDTDCEKDD